MDTSIAVLGNGVWGKKLNALFQSWGFKVSQYGARSFLELNFERQQKILENDVVWIASTPDLQLRIISDVSRYQKSSILILEKPFFRDLNEQIKFVEIMNNSDLYLRSSSPWVYSDIWSKSKKKLSELLNPLEIGPGHGLYLAHTVNKCLPDSQITALDISETSLRLTREIVDLLSTNRVGVNYVVDNVENYSSEKFFDFITMGEVIEHLDDPKSVLIKIRKMLKPNGLSFLTTCVNCPAIDHVYLFSNVNQIRDMFEAAGLQILEEIVLPVEKLPMDVIISKKICINYAAVVKSKND